MNHSRLLRLESPVWGIRSPATDQLGITIKPFSPTVLIKDGEESLLKVEGEKWWRRKLLVLYMVSSSGRVEA